MKVFVERKTYTLLKSPEAARSSGLSPIEPRMEVHVASVRSVGLLTLSISKIALAMRSPEKVTRYIQARPFLKPCLKMTAMPAMMARM